MLTKRRCPYTGVINFFFEPEPFLAVGSITKTARSKGYIWRSYVGEEAAGLSTAMATAETRLAGLLLSATVGEQEAAPLRANRSPYVGVRDFTQLPDRGALPCR
jgi:hypothetical protein